MTEQGHNGGQCHPNSKDNQECWMPRNQITGMPCPSPPRSISWGCYMYEYLLSKRSYSLDYFVGVNLIFVYFHQNWSITNLVTLTVQSKTSYRLVQEKLCFFHNSLQPLPRAPTSLWDTFKALNSWKIFNSWKKKPQYLMNTLYFLIYFMCKA